MISIRIGSRRARKSIPRRRSLSLKVFNSPSNCRYHRNDMGLFNKLDGNWKISLFFQRLLNVLGECSRSSLCVSTAFQNIFTSRSQWEKCIVFGWMLSSHSSLGTDDPVVDRVDDFHSECSARWMLTLSLYRSAETTPRNNKGSVFHMAN